MKFVISRDALITPLSLVAGVVERRQTLPILANVQLSIESNILTVTGTDLEVELQGRIPLNSPADVAGEITVPGRKLLDICKALPESSDLQFSMAEDKLILKSGRSRFTLSTLPASDFPTVDHDADGQSFNVLQADLKHMIDRTSFAMAQQDVRYYLNGMLWELSNDALRLVATDGHRLAMCTLKSDALSSVNNSQVIVPRKGVLEMARLLGGDSDEAQISIGSNHIRVATSDYTFTSKLIDGKFPDYERVLPRNSSKEVIGDRNELRQAFSRTAILSNEKYRGIRVTLSNDQLTIVANNPEQEEAEEVVGVDYQGEGLEIGFNVNYLVDVLTVLNTDRVKIHLSDANSSALLEEAEDGDSMYVVMPMRL